MHLTYFVHGTTLDNEQRRSSGWNDVALSERGLEEAQKLRDMTADRHFDAVYCSDLQRARVTAEIAFGGRFPVVQDARLRECNYGDLNGGPSDEVEPMQERMIHERFPDGESYDDVAERVKSLLDEIKETYEGKQVAFVAHKAPQLVLDVLIKQKSWEQAFADDWRKTKSWQPGWDIEVS